MIHLQNKARQLGFSLIELAIVLLIVTLLLGGLLVPLTAQIDQQRTKETQKTLAELKEALIGFAIVNGRLPCPATPNSSTGLESYSGTVGASACTNPFNGLVPAATLGVSPVNNKGLLLDGWNNPIRYAVSDANIGTSTNALTTSNGMKTATISSLAGAKLLYICSSSSGITLATCGSPTPPTIKLTDNAPALVYSLGKNGNTGVIGPDENANTDGNLVFVSHEQSPDGASNEGFDDIANWLSSSILINRMVAAGQLP